jgi:hypothetical protein
VVSVVRALAEKSKPMNHIKCPQCAGRFWTDREFYVRCQCGAIVTVARCRIGSSRQYAPENPEQNSETD